MADQEARTTFEFEVADTAHLSRYGIVVVGWYRSGSVQLGETIYVAGLPDRPTKVTGTAVLCGGPLGSPDGHLVLEDRKLAAEIAAGHRIKAWPEPGDIPEH